MLAKTWNKYLFIHQVPKAGMPGLIDSVRMLVYVLVCVVCVCLCVRACVCACTRTYVFVQVYVELCVHTGAVNSA